jgi:hypothetical protein
MAHTFLVFDFGTNEDAAQQARHKMESWKQGFRLGNKILLKFEREDGGEPAKAAAKAAKGGTSSSKADKATKGVSEEPSSANGRVRVLIRLDFSEHERLSHQRWMDRIPNEEPFKSAKHETVRQGDPTFGKTEELFDSLD